MGNIIRRDTTEPVNSSPTVTNSEDYHYPSHSGSYFGRYFIMGGERFEIDQPEAYLFGDNSDLNFLSHKSLPFPYSIPLPHEPTRTLRALINIRKETLRLVIAENPTIIRRVGETEENNSTTTGKLENPKNHISSSSSPLPSTPSSQSIVISPATIDHHDESQSKPEEPSKPPPNLYNIEFVFDSDVKCSISIHYLCKEEITSSGIKYTPVKNTQASSSSVYFYPKGANQLFSQTSHLFSPSKFTGKDLIYRTYDESGYFDPTIPYPIVIQCQAEEGDQPRQSHSLIAIVEKNHEFHYTIKPFKQKTFIDGLTYLIQEVYGIENKKSTGNGEDKMLPNEEDEYCDNSYECVICMSEPRDTLILPCRHLCLCNACADSLRYQANNCPICRSPFRALLQLKAVVRSRVEQSTSNISPSQQALPTPISNSTTATTTNTPTVTTILTSVVPEQPQPPTTRSSSTFNCPFQAMVRSQLRNYFVHNQQRQQQQTSTSLTANSANNRIINLPTGYKSVSLIEALNGATLNNSSNNHYHNEVNSHPENNRTESCSEILIESTESINSNPNSSQSTVSLHRLSTTSSSSAAAPSSGLAMEMVNLKASNNETVISSSNIPVIPSQKDSTDIDSHGHHHHHRNQFQRIAREPTSSNQITPSESRR